MLVIVKSVLRSVLGVRAVLDRGGCIACACDRICTHRWYSPAGEMEYNKSGCCERCFDVLVAPDEYADPGAGAELTAFGKQVVSFWLTVHKTHVCRMTRRAAASLLIYVNGQSPWPPLRVALASV